jgi:hypothetical protein
MRPYIQLRSFEMLETKVTRGVQFRQRALIHIPLTILLVEAAGGLAPHAEAAELQRDGCIRG